MNRFRATISVAVEVEADTPADAQAVVDVLSERMDEFVVDAEIVGVEVGELTEV